MASMSNPALEPTKESSPKRLSELLQEQQEPFRLEVYLYERGCKRSRRAKSSSISSGGAVKICSGIAKDLCSKFVCINEVLKLKDWSFSGGEFSDGVIKGRRKHEKVEELSSGSFSTEFNSFSESDAEDSSPIQTQSHHQNHDDAADRMVQWRMIEENKQCSPVSVLDEIEMISNDFETVTSSGQQVEEHHPSRLSFSFPNLKKATEECIFSATLWELFVGGTSKSSCSRHTNSKNALQQTRRLLFDCVREAVESQGKAGDLIKCWDKNSVNGMKINKLLRSDLMSSYEEQGDSEEEIVKEVGDKILEEIKDEMADEIVDLYCCKAHKCSS